jgi:hypothetical protein
MTEEQKVARRAFLVTAAVGAGTVGAMSLAGPASAAIEKPSQVPATKSVAPLPEGLVGSDWRWVKLESGHGRTTGNVRADDGTTGTFRSTPLDAGAHLHVISFTDGTLIAIGSGLTQGAYAVVGGTGRYAGVTGAYTATQSPLGRYGEGTSEFTLALRSA